MSLKIQHWTAILLGVSSVSLSVLVPGGPIETRSFAHINPLTLGGSEEHTSELQSLTNLVCRLLLEKKNNTTTQLLCYHITQLYAI